MSTAKAKNMFLNRVRTALGHAPNESRRAFGLVPCKVAPDIATKTQWTRNRTRTERLELLDVLEQAAAPINLHVHRVSSPKEAGRLIAELAETSAPEWGGEKSVCAWDHPLVEQCQISHQLQKKPISYHLAGQDDISLRKTAETALIGVTAADFCVAESATQVHFSGPGRARIISLLPSIHVAILDINALLPNFDELYAHLHVRHQEQKQTNGVGLEHTQFISGPSKTGDIEAVMVHGAHGPREAHLFVIT